MANPSEITSPRLAQLDAELERWRQKRIAAAQRVTTIDEHITELEAARAAELAAESPPPPPDPDA